MAQKSAPYPLIRQMEKLRLREGRAHIRLGNRAQECLERRLPAMPRHCAEVWRLCRTRKVGPRGKGTSRGRNGVNKQLGDITEDDLGER